MSKKKKEKLDMLIALGNQLEYRFKYRSNDLFQGRVECNSNDIGTHYRNIWANHRAYLRHRWEQLNLPTTLFNLNDEWDVKHVQLILVNFEKLLLNTPVFEITVNSEKLLYSLGQSKYELQPK